MAKAAVGLADEIVSTVLLAFDGPIIVAPAMNWQMWCKPPVVRNIAQLRADGMVIIGPETGHLSCGEVGAGTDGRAGGHLQGHCGGTGGDKDRRKR